ncbi:conserved protein, unknown function [Hepatocystis sp. ex Piliocolobus tephrosceles]|nr:conserved protein, unknown function [Hepatocystis sp. ex Piliocolobus tephrosceles]
MLVRINAKHFFFGRHFGTVNNLLKNSFNIYTNNSVVPSSEFYNEVVHMKNKLVYYVNYYFGLDNNSEKKSKKKKIGCLFPPCYSQLVFKFSILLNNFDYISIPSPIKGSKHIKKKYYFYISENNVDLILCHPFYKHYIEELSFHLQIPFLICYDKPDILSNDEYLQELKEGLDVFGTKFLHKSEKEKKKSHLINEKACIINEKACIINEKTFNVDEKKCNVDEKKCNVDEKKCTTNKSDNMEATEKSKTLSKKNENENENICMHLQISKPNECDKSVIFTLPNILNQAKSINKYEQLIKKDDYVLICIPTNYINYFDIIFSLIYEGATIVFPEVCQHKLLNKSNDYMGWFKKHMKKKNNNFNVHELVIKNNFDNNDFNFIEGSSLFEEINNNVKNINVIVCNNYLISDFIDFFENSNITNVTKSNFINNKAKHVTTILINGNEIMPGIHKKYIQYIQNIFTNAKIYQRYVIQEIGTICLIELTQFDDNKVPYDRKLAGYVLPHIHIEIDKETSLLKIKSDTIFTEYYNNEQNTLKALETNTGLFKTKYVASLTNNNSLLKIEGVYNDIKNLPKEYFLYFKQRKDKMEKHPPGYLKRVRMQGQIWGNFHANKRNWKKKF